MGDEELAYGLDNRAGDLYRDFELIGSAETVIATLKHFSDTMPLTDIVHSGPAAGVPIRTEAYRDLKRFANEVLPVIKSW
jgi:hypothetical protein